ncbi:MAG: phosphodiester glycosidase family protein [Gemmatimonadetes bacterium]|nr:phosphodiester glycosidase family protein [Gemmatimonadota bacterium]MBT5143169.1 phosphodiester glycosidase family protein [Gemmatimonadota bacterium]MBT5590761.1 phosphodiester glycosidase family protein [Gemmatimonadota bacterium]MBT5963590.1 phosphodiester glycosidase family protein [Gemmatimonadota bacterium]MBT6627215.1 phosphodiester glycosidase family protein [Gemmatimonadota bacterium]
MTSKLSPTPAIRQALPCPVRSGRRLKPLALTVLLAGAGCQGPSIPAETETIAPGVWHHAVHLIDGPWALHVVEVDLPAARRAGIRLQSARAPLGDIGLEKTSVLGRKALVAINGDFWHSQPVHSAGIQVRDGELLEMPGSLSAFAIGSDGNLFIDVFDLDVGLVTASGRSLSISHVNRDPRGPDGLTYFNHHAQAWTDTVHADVGFVLQAIDPGGWRDTDTVRARVLQVRRHRWPLKLAPGQWLVAGGANFAREVVTPGDTVRLFQRFPPASSGLREAIGGGPRIVRNGVVSIEHEAENLDKTFAMDRHPRTALGVSANGKTLFLVTVDGRQPGYSVGMSLEELAAFMTTKLSLFTKSRANSAQALNLDGGGSTTMVVRNHVVNRPSDPTGESAVANALLVVANDDDR